jgi:hypothetical protein
LTGWLKELPNVIAVNVFGRLFTCWLNELPKIIDSRFGKSFNASTFLSKE